MKSTFTLALVLILVLVLGAVRPASTGAETEPANTARLARGMAETQAEPMPARPESVSYPALEILAIPREDLPRAPGYSKAGIFLPLSRLTALVREASRKHPDASGAQPAPVYCTAVELAGHLDDALALEGTVAYEAPAAGWTATRLDDGALPWIAQGKAVNTSTSGPLAEAFLARIDGATWLFAKGPGRGRLPLRALLPAAPRAGETTLGLGSFAAPCRVTMTLASGLRLTSATLPVQAAGDTTRTLTLWPAQGRPGWLRLTRQAPLEGPASLALTLERTLRALGGALEVTDELKLEDRFRAGRPLRLPLPAGLRLLRAEAVGPGGRKEKATLEATSASLILTPLEDVPALSLRAVFAATLQAGRARPGGWTIPAVAARATLTLVASDGQAPFAAALPAELHPAGGDARTRRYRCDRMLPELAIDLAPTQPPLPPRIDARLHLRRGEADATFEIQLAGTRQRDILFNTPPGWVLTELESRPAGEAKDKPAWTLPATIQQLTSSTWTVSWNPQAAPGSIRAALHRAGAWGAPGTSATLELPFLRLAGQRPRQYDLRVDWPGQFDVRPEALTALADLPLDGGANGLNLRAAGDRPAGALRIHGRAADIRATLVTALGIGEDQARVRALLTWKIGNAPASTFRFLLPAGSGAGVRIEGEGIRESTLRATPQGDEWTVVTQRGITGDFPLTLEWPLAARPGQAPIEAPAIRPLDVTAQQGFVVLESSETMLLAAEARNLAETDLAEVPATPWPRDNRILGVWRYVDPAYTLRVTARKFTPEPPLGGLVREARLVTTVAPEGIRLTRAIYSLLPMSDRQFFELRLPEGAALWSALVNGEGVKPAMRSGAKGERLLLVPLPAATGDAGEFTVTVLYEERDARPLTGRTRLALAAPALSDPINKTAWTLNLPPGFEYLTYGGSMVNTTTVRLPLLTFLRTAFYPSRLVFLGASTAGICLFTLVAFVFFLILRRRHNQPPPPLAEPQPDEPSGPEGEPTPPPLPQAAPQPVAPPRQGWFGMGCLLLAVVMIVLVLAAIAVPNFLEAQTRSKISRARGDLRTISIAMETYYLDMNSYPTDTNILWQGPVKYLSSQFPDPFAPTPGTPLRYLTGPEAVRRGKAAGYFAPDMPDSMTTYLIYSVGPDGKDDGGEIVYDPSNGTESRGDVIRVKDGGSPQYTGRTFTDIRKGEGMGGGTNISLGGVAAPASAPAAEEDKDLVPLPTSPPPKASFIGTPTQIKSPNLEKNELEKEQESILSLEQEANKPGMLSFQREALQRVIIEERMQMRSAGTVKKAMPRPQSFYGRGGYGFGPAGAAGNQPVTPIARQAQAGLLSLAIEIPEGGVQRSFETLGGDARIDLRLLEQDRFLKWRFMVWMAAFLALAGLWLNSPLRWKKTFVAGIAFTLFVPVLMQSAWVVFFNTAFQGILFSAVVPLLAWTVRRLRARLAPSSGITSLMLLALALAALGGRVHAAPPVRILVPYDGATWNAAGPDPLAFMSKRDFTNLWNLAHPEAARSPQPAPTLGELRLEGAFDPEVSAFRGTLTLRAINPADTPTSLPLALAGLALEGAAADPPGAAIEPRAGGLVLRLDARWAGIVRAPLLLRCESQGSSGRLKLELPEAAAGLWRLTFPWHAVTPRGPGAAGCVAEALPAGTALLGPVRPGTLELAWSAGQTAVSATAGAPQGWRCVLDNHYTFTGPADAEWRGGMTLSAESSGGMLPTQVRFRLDPGVRIFAAEGEALRATQVTGGEVIFTLAPVQEATLRLQGIATPAGTRPFTLPALRPPRGIAALMHVTLDVAEDLELISIDPRRLERMTPQDTRPAFGRQLFQTAEADWRLALELARPAPVFGAAIREAFVTGSGLLRQAAALEITPRSGVLTECRINLPPGRRILSLTGDGLAAWTQDGRTVALTFDPPRRASARLRLTAVEDVAATSGALTLAPLELAGAAETRRLAALLVAPGVEIQEVAMAGAAPRVPDAGDTGLLALLSDTGKPLPPANPKEILRQLLGEPADPAEVLRGWTLASAAPLRLRLAPVQAAAFTRILNRVTLAEGIQTLEGTVVAEPRRGRLRQVEALLLNATPGSAARLQATGHVRHVSTEPAGAGILKVRVELDAPRDRAVTIHIHYDQPAATGTSQSLHLALLTPAGEPGSRAFLLLHPALDGELTPAGLAGAREADPAELAWADPGLRAQPSDRIYELASRSREVPAFSIRRHARDEALRAFVEIMRHRTILTRDGLERNELEIVLQNQSLQFLKIALPYPRARVTIYEVQVAARTVKTTFGREDGREVLLIPLIRTGLLDPELTVRVAYTARGGAPLAGHGTLRHAMPEVLGGVPVGQSTMILMLPSEFKYSGFQGTMNRVEMVDLEVDEALRTTRRLEQLSQTALANRGFTQRLMLERLNQARGEAASRLKSARQTSKSYLAQSGQALADTDDAARQQKLAGEREQNLKLAEQAASNTLSNSAQLMQIVQENRRDRGVIASAPAPVAPPPAARRSVEFPRAGDVLAFRRLQGTGDVRFDYTARQTGEHRGDLLLGLALTLAAAVAVTQSRRLFATRRRLAGFVMVAALLAILARTALDLAIPGLALGVMLLLGWGKREGGKA